MDRNPSVAIAQHLEQRHVGNRALRILSGKDEIAHRTTEQLHPFQHVQRRKADCAGKRSAAEGAAMVAGTEHGHYVVARQEGRQLASQLDLSPSDLTVIASAISEVARNIVEYATRGEVLVRLIEKNGRRGGRR